MFIAGLVIGALAAAVFARWQIKRSLGKARAAERRARDAERLAELGAMTGGLAHEIKNPLSTIGLNAQLLAEGIDDLDAAKFGDSEQKQRLVRRVSALRRETERLRGILQDFLSYAGEMRLDMKPADINLAVDELADFFLPQAQQQGVRMRIELADGPLTAMVDVPHMKQAVLNLMLNAVQAMTMPGSAAGLAGPKELIVRTMRAREPDGQDVVRMSVIDTGPGIPPDVMPRIFTPYFTTKAGGSGLGLPTTKRIVDSQHGRIDVHSEAGTGTAFTITLPAAKPSETEPAASAEPGSGR